jgi:hypothetical protein
MLSCSLHRMVDCTLRRAGCLVLALLQALASSGSGPATADSSCQTSRTGQLEGLKGRLLQLEDAYMAKVRCSSCCCCPSVPQPGLSARAVRCLRVLAQACCPCWLCAIRCGSTCDSWHWQKEQQLACTAARCYTRAAPWQESCTNA